MRFSSLNIEQLEPQENGQKRIRLEVFMETDKEEDNELYKFESHTDYRSLPLALNKARDLVSELQNTEFEHWGCYETVKREDE